MVSWHWVLSLQCMLAWKLPIVAYAGMETTYSGICCNGDYLWLHMLAWRLPIVAYDGRETTYSGICLDGDYQ